MCQFFLRVHMTLHSFLPCRGVLKNGASVNNTLNYSIHTMSCEPQQAENHIIPILSADSTKQNAYFCEKGWFLCVKIPTGFLSWKGLQSG